MIGPALVFPLVSWRPGWAFTDGLGVSPPPVRTMAFTSCVKRRATQSPIRLHVTAFKETLWTAFGATLATLATTQECDTRMYNNLRTQGPLSGPTTAGGGWSRKYIDFAQNPTLFDGKRFISYDDPVSIKAKAAWAKGQGLGGLLIWELSQDNAGELVAAVNAGWGSPVQPSPTSSTAATLTTSQVRSVVKTTTTTIISFPVTSASSTSPVEPAPVSSSTVITSPAAPSQTIPVMTHSATAPSTLTSVFTSVVISSVVSAPVASASPVAPVTRPNVGTQVIGGYLLLNPTEGPDKLRALAANAASLPINRVFLSFVRPDMVYVPDSNTLEFADIGYASSGDYGFAEVKNHIAQLQAGGVEVYMSMGGWNYNCYPYFYTKYSIGSFPTGNNYWKIQQYGGGSISGCNESNMWCYTCEPQSANTTLKDFIVFPEPENSDSWKAAQAYIVQNTKGNPVQWHPNMIGGAQFTDPVDGQTVTTVPGNNMWLVKNRNPYEDFVYLAKDLGLDGIDLDYEEMWHADTFRSGNLPGPFKLDQTVYKYTAIARNMQTAIQQIYSSCKLSTAAGAAGAWQGNWWGGNLKGLWYYSNLWFPAVTQFMSVGANAGGINVMSYDLSNNNQFFECPNTVDDCDLAGQVKFYMNTYAIANIPARVGYEIGQAAYPDPEIDPSHQIPLTQAALDAILFGVPSVTTQGGFFWELYKARNSLPTGPSGQPNNIDVTTLAQQICAKLFPNAARCKGVIPDFTVTPVVLSSTVVSHTASSAVVTSTLATTLSKRVQTSSSFSAPIIAPSSVPPSDVPVLIPSFGSSAVPSVTPVSSSVSSSAAPIKTTKVPVSVPASDCYPAWDASAAYFDAKNKVSYNGMNYVASWWTQGSNPSQNADGVWVNKGACGGIASSASSSGPRPVQTTASAGDCHPAWDASAIYSGSSNKASFNGFNYAATWWTQGSNPTENKDGVWIKTGPCGAAAPLVTSVAAPVVNGNCFDAYEPSVKYVGGSNVSYKGFNWQASWWQNAGWDPVSNKDGGWVKKDACGSSTIIQTSASVSASASTVPVPVPSSSTDAPAPVPQPEPSVSTSPASLSSSAETPKPTTTAIVGNTSSDVPKPAVTTSNASPAVSSTPIVPKPIQTTSDVTSAPTSLVVVPTTTGSSSGWSACGSVWSASQNYPVGTTVSIDKINYITKWYQNAGSNPTSNTDGGWSTVGACDPTLPIPSGPGGKPPVATNLAGARAYAASLSQDPTLLLLKNQVRTNPNIDGIHPGNSANPDNVKRVERIVTPTKWNVTYFSQADPAYTYTNFLKSVGFFTGFCDTYPGKNSDGICKRLLATMFAHFAQETGAHSKLLPIPEWQQSLVYLREMSCTENDTISGCYYNNDCGNPAFNKVFPCGKGPNNGYLAYFGRGAHQLSYSFNYGPFSQVIYNDPTVLLNNPALVADTWLNIASAIFFFIYPQPPKPSMLGVIDGSWIPNASDAAAGRTNDFPSTIQIINGECAGSSLSNAASNRISFYQSFAADMGLDTSKEAFKCSGMGAFDTSSAGVYPMYWTASYLNQNECQLVSYQTNFNALMDGPNYDQYVKCVQFSFNSTLA
ncbi:hypothetical protein BC830DRAFT_818710 [Chytriomyces sp. MP71]|nr:hypothetical protein BC830DRAFT_818710 [Chytriomyces sp. MP71]